MTINELQVIKKEPELNRDKSINLLICVCVCNKSYRLLLSYIIL